MTRGDVYRVRQQPIDGQKQYGWRHIVVLSADELHGAGTVIVAPTSRRAVPASFRPLISVTGQVHRVLVEQLHVVPVDRLRHHAAHLTSAEQRAVDEALEAVLAL